MEKNKIEFCLESDIDLILKKICKHKDAINNKCFFIFGGGGFLGKYFQSVISKFNNVKIVCIDINDPVTKIHGVKYVKHDITKNFDNVFEDIPDYIIAGASIASPKVYKKNPILCLDVGYKGLQNCLELAVKHKSRLLFFSSSEVYGDANIIPTPENYVGAIPSDSERSCYDLSKIVGSSLVHYYIQQKNLNASIVLPFNFYGPMENDGRVIPSFLYNIVNDKPVTVYENGAQKRCYTDIVDGITGCLKVLICGNIGEKYNIGNPNEEISVLDLAKKIETVINKKIKIDIIKYPENYAGKGDPMRRVPSIIKANKDLDFYPTVSLEDGIIKFYNWAKIAYLY